MIRWLDVRSLWRAIQRNWPLKFFSLAFAVGLWAFVNFGERDAEKTLVVPLELRNLTPKLIVTSPIPDSVDVRLKGPSTLLGTIDGRDEIFRLDLARVRTGESSFRIEADMLALPRSVRVIRLSPSQVSLKVEPLAEKELPVVVDFAEAVPRGFRVTGTDVQPPFVRVTGPEAHVKGWDHVSTQPVYLIPKSGAFEKVVALQRGGEYTRVAPDRVNVRVRLQEIVGRQEFRDVKIGVRHADVPYRLKDRRADVVLAGPERILREIKGDRLDAYVDAAGLATGNHDLPVQLVLPEGLDVVQIRPSQVALELLPKPAAEAGESAGT
jgi:YbbR domain-containing protein